LNIQTLDSLFPMGQIKLSEVSVCNWGSFNGIHTAKFNPDGTLVSGETGAGKSTLIDGFMTLLQGPSGTYNVAAAQEDKNDRSVVTYMRGNYAQKSDGIDVVDQCVRPDSVITGLRALFKADDGSKITLFGIFEIKGTGRTLSDVRRVYIILREDMPLKKMLDDYREQGSNFKRSMRDSDACLCVTDKFKEYKEQYLNALNIENPNAPSLLARALGLKQIKDLTSLIRDLVLEPNNIRESARKVVEEFENLVSTHDEMIDVGEQVKLLAPLESHRDNIESAQVIIDNCRNQGDAVDAFMAQVETDLLDQRILTNTREMQVQIASRNTAEDRKGLAVEDVERYRDLYNGLGGDKGEQIKQALVQANKENQRALGIASNYRKVAGALTLDATLSEALVNENITQSHTELETLRAQTETLLHDVADKRSKVTALENEQGTLTEELNDLKQRPNSNVQYAYQKMRDQIVQELNIPADELVFVAELIDVKEEESDWQGAIERALGGRKLTLLMPQDHYARINKWVNSHHLGLKLSSKAVDLDNFSNRQAHFKEQGFLRKLVWKEHPYRDWLKSFLLTHDIDCVESVEAMNAQPYSMTKQGMIHRLKGQFDKDDRHHVSDKKHWSLGFSNERRLQSLVQQLATLSESLRSAQEASTKAEAAFNGVGKQIENWKSLSAFNWDDMNVAKTQGVVDNLTQNLEAIQEKAGELKDAEQQWEEARARVKTIEGEISQLNRVIGGYELNIQRDKDRQTALTPLLNELDEEIEVKLKERLGAIDVTHLSQIGDRKAKISKSISDERGSASKVLSNAVREITVVITKFKANPKWSVIATDWGNDASAASEYIDYYLKLKEEGLPELQEQFKQRLNQHATQSLAHIVSEIDGERDEIIERIESINEVLEGTEFQTGSYLKLITKRERFPNIVQFETRVKNTLSLSTSDDHEARFEALAEVIEQLRDAVSRFETKECKRLLDPRFQISFTAQELSIKTGDVLDTLGGTSGKSGGEKEGFAGCIVAASLAYVLTPDGARKPVYSTVILDEAFSNTSQGRSRLVLNMFDKLGLHVNLVTPFKNIEIARDAASSLVIAEKQLDAHYSRLIEMTWKEVDEQILSAQLAEAKVTSINDAATTMGIKVYE